jgi:hypothetical protein
MSESDTENKNKEPSHKMDGNYVILMETNGEEYESWYYFIRVEGNEENLQHIQKQFEKVDWHILDDLSTFDLDLENTISAKTAKEMTKVDLNHTSFHRKFDGKLKKIDFDFKKNDGNSTKICKIFDMLGYGQIDDYISDEDIDPEDLVSNNSDSTDSESISDNSSSRDSDSEIEDLRNKTKRLPPSLKKV